MPQEYRGNLSPRIDWTAHDDGSIVGAVAVTSPEALAMRAGIRAELGAEGAIRFFYPDAGQAPLSEHFPVVTETDFLDGGEPETLWSPTVEGDSIGIEITLPSRGALSTFSIQIVQVSHIFVPMRSLLSGKADTPLFQRDLPLGCDNHVDVQCRTGRFPNNLEDSVALISFVLDGGSHTCTGTLLNDTVDGSFITKYSSGSFRDCAALAYGEGAGVGCLSFRGDGSTLSAAESASLSGCRRGGFSNCRIWTNRSGLRISGCNAHTGNPR